LENDEELPLSQEALQEVALEIKSAMEDAAKALDFEEAARLRDRLMLINDRLDAAGID
jgi:excinuclease UvrABC nuclease subunit